MKAETMAAWVAILAVAEMVAVAEGAKEAAMVVAEVATREETLVEAETVAAWVAREGAAKD